MKDLTGNSVRTEEIRVRNEARLFNVATGDWE